MNVRDSYPILRMDELLDFFEDARIFSTLYLYPGYWQVNDSQGDRQ